VRARVFHKNIDVKIQIGLHFEPTFEIDTYICGYVLSYYCLAVANNPDINSIPNMPRLNRIIEEKTIFYNSTLEALVDAGYQEVCK